MSTGKTDHWQEIECPKCREISRRHAPDLLLPTDKYDCPACGETFIAGDEVIEFDAADQPVAFGSWATI